MTFAYNSNNYEAQITNAIVQAGTVSSSAPASATATGTTGQIAFDATHLYICIAANTWVRCTVATW